MKLPPPQAGEGLGGGLQGSERRPPALPPLRGGRSFSLVLLVFLLLGGCTTTIVPPAAVAEKASVAVLDHGRHTSLLVEVPGEAVMARYAYGDWRWYALGQTGVIEGIAALSGNKSALGRKRLPGPLTPDTVPHRVTVGIEEALYFEAEARDVRRLAATLDAIFAANTAERIDNAAYGLEFVPHPQPYGALHNSNQMVARWLEALGCRIEGPAVYADWKLARPQ